LTSSIKGIHSALTYALMEAIQNAQNITR